MTYQIGDIRPNPFRNIDRYQINREKVERLKEFEKAKVKAAAA